MYTLPGGLIRPCGIGSSKTAILTATAGVSYNGITLTNSRSVAAYYADNSTCWLYGWVPQLAPNILTNPVALVVSAGQSAVFSVVNRRGIPDPTYQWLKQAPTSLAPPARSIPIRSCWPDQGGYSVIVSNIAGTATSTTATLHHQQLREQPAHGPTHHQRHGAVGSDLYGYVHWFAWH